MRSRTGAKAKVIARAGFIAGQPPRVIRQGEVLDADDPLVLALPGKFGPVDPELKWLVATAGFICEVDGIRRTIRRGSKVRADDPVVKQFAGKFARGDLPKAAWPKP
jgi:hypothetical protein